MRDKYLYLESLFHSLFGLVVACLLRDRVVNVVDLDNTLIQTRKFQLSAGRTDVFNELDFPSMGSVARTFYWDCKNVGPTFILTARPYSSFVSTGRYLRRELNVSFFVLCRTANLKMIYLQFLNKYCAEVRYYDDLSHGVDEVRLYSDLISRVEELDKVKYFGLNYVNKFILCD
jgi:hypothetical protein